jgi:hypothetical protein
MRKRTCAKFDRTIRTDGGLARLQEIFISGAEAEKIIVVAGHRAIR